MGEVCCRELPETKSHKCRRYHWCAARPGNAHLGRVVVLQGERELDCYEVSEDTSQPFPGRAFVFRRETGDVTPDRPGVYRVLVQYGGLTATCTCMGSITRHGAPICKHAHVALDLFTRGDLGATASPAETG